MPSFVSGRASERENSPKNARARTYTHLAIASERRPAVGLAEVYFVAVIVISRCSS